MKEVFPGVWRNKNKLYTKNIVPGKSIYGERRIIENGTEFREWDPHRSKPAAAILKGIKHFPIKKGITILYLGIANGTTSSHFCDIIGKEGTIIGIDIATKMFEKLMEVAEEREAIIPILADANKPSEYEEYLDEKADMLYQDISQKHQVEIFLKNMKFVKDDGYCILALKARSIDVSKNPRIIYKDVLNRLKMEKINILETKEIGPYEKDHLFIICQK